MKTFHQFNNANEDRFNHPDRLRHVAAAEEHFKRSRKAIKHIIDDPHRSIKDSPYWILSQHHTEAGNHHTRAAGAILKKQSNQVSGTYERRAKDHEE